MTLDARDLGRSFGRIRAVEGVSVTLTAGRVHAFVGENGAGKSTLLKMLAGAERPDTGAMTLDGAPYAPTSLADAAGHGVALVFQEVTVNPALGVAENIFIDRLRRFATGGFLDSRAMDRAAQDVLDRLGARIRVDADLARLDLGQWKCIEIARALSRDPKVLFLDESTAYLDHREVDAVLAAIRRLREEGLTIAFVSHHLAEVRAVADDLTILKDGREVGHFAVGDIAPDDIHRRMVGRDISGGIYPARPPRPVPAPAPVFRASRVELASGLRDASLDVAAGEILGVAGLKGAGGEALFAAIAGDRPLARGAMELDGAPYHPRAPADAWRHGVAHLPGDRTGEGLIVDFSVLDNLVMARPPRRGPFFDRARALDMAGALVRRIGIKAPDADLPVRTLSGGNMQKVVLGKCLATRPKLLLLNNPTRGVDVGARLEIYRIIRELAADGLAVILLSEDLPELLGLADRLVVMRHGEIAHRCGAAGASEHDIVRHMT
ncbi:sugar ABC transporter ATP-binding protein [Ancylobacter terrae]|uniref:sugar ABC transporter ATP-binding protein n=1 Tax=Ancylobacter sp. sgz301288 TaxID=3342077 RepID=UPI00385F98DE